MNEESLFREALGRSAEERTTFLEQACAGRPELRIAVEALLAAHEKSGVLLEGSAGELASTVAADADRPALDATLDFVARTDQAATIEARSHSVAKTLENARAGDNGSHAQVKPAEYPPLSRAGALIAGRYILQEKIGEGGMGEVWVARQMEPVKRKVALKLIKTGMDSRAVLQRFEQERQALALMEHPNIAKVLDAGLTPTGQPFFVMELVDGLPLTRFCDEATLTPRDRLDLFVPICQAVQHAHQKGVIHRDLKPANILVTVVDGKPVPKVIDFGLAKATAGKLTEATMATQIGSVVGTLEYMSPEQAGFAIEDIDTRADIYSLGVILYELLTGLHPIDGKRFREAALTEMIRIVQQDEPSKPSTRLSTSASLPSLAAGRCMEPKKLTALLRGDLDWIVMKCLEKKRERRYETANGLVRDVQRFLAGDPVEACPPSVSYRLSKFVNKHRAGLATAVGIGVLLAAATAISTWQAIRAHEAEKRADRERVAALQLSRRESQAREQAERANDQLTEAQRALTRRYYATRVNLAGAAFESNDVGRTRSLLDQVRPQPGEADLRGFEWDYWQRRCHQERFVFTTHESSVQRVICSPDGRRVASADWGGRVLIWDAATGQIQLDFKAHADRVNGLAFSPDGQRLATAGSDKMIKVWDALTGSPLLSFQGHSGAVLALAYSPDGKRLASGSATRSVKLWDAADGRLLHQAGSSRAREVTCVAFSPDGRLIASGGRDRLVKLWDGETLQPIRTLGEHGDSVQCLAFSPDSGFVATGSIDRDVRIWAVATDHRDQILRGHEGAVYGVAFSPDGRTVASGGADQTVRVWNLEDGREIRRFPGHSDLVTHVTHTPDGHRIISSAFDKTVRIWDVESLPEPRTLDEPSVGVVQAAAYSPDGRSIAFGGNHQFVEIRDALTGEPKAKLRGHTRSVYGIAFHPGGHYVASVSSDQSLRVWDLDTHQPFLTLEGLEGNLHAVAYSPDGRYLVADHPPGRIHVRNAMTGQVVMTLMGAPNSIHAIAFSPDGRALVAGGTDRALFTWDLETGAAVHALQGHSDTVESVTFSPDGRWIASSSHDHTVKIWDAKSGLELRTLKGHSGAIRAIAYSPDGRRLASASEDRTAKLFDTTSGEELLTLKGHGGWVYCLAFSPDGHRLVTGSFDRSVKLWNAVPLNDP